MLANNYLPAKKTWEKRAGNRSKHWPSDQQLKTLQEAVKLLESDGPFCSLLDEPEPGGPGRAGFADYCVAIVCDQRGVKDWRGL